MHKFALIYASKKKFSNDLYFRYYKIECFCLKDFATFLDLIKKDIIKITLLLSKQNTKTKEVNRNKGLVFHIGKLNLEKLFNKIYFFEN